MTINVELKTGIFWYKDLEKKVLELTKEMEMEDRVIYSSFNHYSIAKILELDPKASTGIQAYTVTPARVCNCQEI